MTAKRLNVRTVVDLKFAALPNKVLRILRRWAKYGSFTLFRNTYFREQVSLTAFDKKRAKDHNDVKVLPKLSV